MNQLYLKPADFEAVIRIYSFEEGGRATPTFNGIRWDFGYAEPPMPNEIYMIWPDFFAENGDSLNTYDSLPIGVELPARMLILMDKMREFHRQNIHKGTRFYCHEGAWQLEKSHD